MIVDASALLAVALPEADAPRFAEALAGAPRLRIASANWFEAAMVVDRRGDATARNGFDELVRQVGIEIAPLTHRRVLSAREAWRRFGKGKHAAALNFGDCLAYGFAKTEGEALLFKGDDFPQTDIEPALKA